MKTLLLLAMVSGSLHAMYQSPAESSVASVQRAQEFPRLMYSQENVPLERRVSFSNLQTHIGSQNAQALVNSLLYVRLTSEGLRLLQEQADIEHSRLRFQNRAGYCSVALLGGLSLVIGSVGAFHNDEPGMAMGGMGFWSSVLVLISGGVYGFKSRACHNSEVISDILKNYRVGQASPLVDHSAAGSLGTDEAV